MSVDLQETFKASTGAAGAGAAGRTDHGCPPAERIFEASRGELPADEARRLLEHSLGCTDCALAFRLARELLAEVSAGATGQGVAERTLPARTTGRAGAHWMRRRSVAALAGVGVAAAVALIVLRPAPRREPNVAVRGAQPPDFRGGGTELSSLLGDAPLPREAFVLKWSAAGPGARYAVNVAAEDLSAVDHVTGLAATEHQVPARALAALPAGARVVWRVTAILADGSRIESGAFLAKIR